MLYCIQIYYFQDSETNCLDKEAQDLLYYLRDIKLPNQLATTTNIDKLHVRWNELTVSTPSSAMKLFNQWEEENTTPSSLPVQWDEPSLASPRLTRPPLSPFTPKCGSNEPYITRFCESFYDRVTSIITNAMCDIENLATDTFVVEVLQHLYMCCSRCEQFRGRTDLINYIQIYALGSCNIPLVIYGESGCGKTSVLAKVANLSYDWMTSTSSECQPTVVVRFLGKF